MNYKVGFKTLVAPLPSDTLLPDGASVDVSGWTKPMIELEVAVHVGQGLGVALELADVDFPPDDPDRVVANGIYHRHWLLSAPKAGQSPFSARLGEERTDELLDHEAIVAMVEESIGRKLEEGEVVITGSIFPPQPATPGLWRGEVDPLGALAVTITSS
jgi:2-keto-4-pentenoate hydratase